MLNKELEMELPSRVTRTQSGAVKPDTPEIGVESPVVSDGLALGIK